MTSNNPNLRYALIGHGESTEFSGLKASKSVMKKSVYYVGNLQIDTSETAMQNFILEKFGIQCISCYRKRGRGENECRGFRVCVRKEDVKNFTKMELWPKGAKICKWIFRNDLRDDSTL